MGQIILNAAIIKQEYVAKYEKADPKDSQKLASGGIKAISSKPELSSKCLLSINPLEAMKTSISCKDSSVAILKSCIKNLKIEMYNTEQKEQRDIS